MQRELDEAAAAFDGEGHGRCRRPESLQHVVLIDDGRRIDRRDAVPDQKPRRLRGGADQLDWPRVDVVCTCVRALHAMSDLPGRFALSPS